MHVCTYFVRCLFKCCYLSTISSTTVEYLWRDENKTLSSYTSKCTLCSFVFFSSSTQNVKPTVFCSFLLSSVSFCITFHHKRINFVSFYCRRISLKVQSDEREEITSAVHLGRHCFLLVIVQVTSCCSTFVKSLEINWKVFHYTWI